MIEVAVYSQNGGVGKSTVTALLGLALRDISRKVMERRLFSICAHFGEENAVIWKGETGIVEIPNVAMDTIRAWLGRNKDIEERAQEFLAPNAGVRTCFRIVR